MSDPLTQSLALIAAVAVLAAFFAKVEIHVEGEAGWAANLPTWRIEQHWALDLFFGGRAMTGYHAWLLPFMLLIFHLPTVLLWSWTVQIEARCCAAFILFWICEDLLWFVFNPAWGLRRFRRDQVTWHKHWLCGAPFDYWIFSAIAGVLMWFSYRV